MIEIKEEVDEAAIKDDEGEDNVGGQSDSDDLKQSEVIEDSLNNNIQKENLLLKVENEDSLSYDGDDKLEDEGDRLPPLSGMSPVETATLLLLSRIALFNKVGSCHDRLSPSRSVRN